MPRRAILALVLVLAACSGPVRSSRTQTFASLVAELSEPAGSFDTDNLMSNERSYLEVIGDLASVAPPGGVYIGVGPDQNFTYIAHLRPSWAFILDIREDNLLLHLLFKALFELAPTRIEYVTLLFGRPAPSTPMDWEGRELEELLLYVDTATAVEPERGRIRARVDSAIATFGVPLDQAAWRTIDRFHRSFMQEGLGLRFRSFGREPRWFYPTYREFVLERDLQGRRANFLAAVETYRVVRALQLSDRIVPVVGDFAGRHALRAIGSFVARQGRRVEVFYTSNVEFYLFRSGTYAAFIANVAALPIREESIIIRSVFGGAAGRHPRQRSGYGSVQLVQRIRALLDGYAGGRFRFYWDVVNADREGF